MSNAETLPKPRVATEFKFFTRLTLRELTGLKARNVRELLDHAKTVSDAVIYHHTHHFLQEHQYLSPEPPNDFAYWVTTALNEAVLGEELASINTTEFSTIQALRDKIVETLDRFLKTSDSLRQSSEEQSLYFIKAISFVLPTSYCVKSLPEFVEALKKIPINSIYFHMFESKLRLSKGGNDFSNWLQSSLGEEELAKQIAKLDPYTYTMEGLRSRIVQFIETRLKEKDHA